MSANINCEIICPASEQDFWLNWLLDHHPQAFDVSLVRRYGLTSTELSRQEQVQGYANYVRFDFTINAEKQKNIEAHMIQARGNKLLASIRFYALF